MTKRAPLKERMEVNIVLAQSGCMEWVGSRNKLGYGMVSFEAPWGRTSTTAHRKYWELTRGEIPAGMQVNHKCDNRCCVNPDHMFLGDQTANIRDMMAKGRDNFAGRGSYLKRKLSAEKV